MTLAASGTLSLSDIRTEFGGGSGAISMSNLYRGGTRVRSKAGNNTSTNLAASVPTSGTVGFTDFHGQAKGFRKTYTATATNQNASTVFGDDYGVDYPKEIVINSGVELGATGTGEEALQINSGLSGTMTITNNGTLSGAGGAANSGAGGDAFRLMRLVPSSTTAQSVLEVVAAAEVATVVPEERAVRAVQAIKLTEAALVRMALYAVATPIVRADGGIVTGATVRWRKKSDGGATQSTPTTTIIVVAAAALAAPGEMVAEAKVTIMEAKVALAVLVDRMVRAAALMQAAVAGAALAGQALRAVATEMPAVPATLGPQEILAVTETTRTAAVALVVHQVRVVAQPESTFAACQTSHSQTTEQFRAAQHDGRTAYAGLPGLRMVS